MAKRFLFIAHASAFLFAGCIGGQTGELFDSEGGQGGARERKPDAGNKVCQIGDSDKPIHEGQAGVPDAASAGSDSSAAYARFVEVKSDLHRDLTPEVAEGDIAALTRGNTLFALEMYQYLTAKHADQNLLFSPYSISLALAMAYAGAENGTERQMAEALHFTLPESRLHAAFSRIDLSLRSRQKAAAAEDGHAFRLDVTNSIWGQKDAQVLDTYLDLLAVNYGAGLRLVDFIRAPERAREIINEWVLNQTENRFSELLPQGSVDESTQLVLVNAISFDAPWLYQIDLEMYKTGDFNPLSGQSVRVPVMRQLVSGLFQGTGYTAVELRYGGDALAMVILMPDSGQYPSFEARLDAQLLGEAITGLSPSDRVVSMPIWKSNMPSISLKTMLGDMGMTDAFGERADFSGINGKLNLNISDAFHRTFIEVDEYRSVAQASSNSLASITEQYTAPLQTISVDRPFIYLIRDVETGVILFLGRVIDPS